MPATETAIALARAAAQAASDKIGTDIIGLDVSGQLPLTDIFVVASAANERQVGSIVDAVEETLLKDHEQKVIRREGKGEGRWVLIDFGDIIVHVFHEEDRQFYALERLWSDCPVVDLQIQAAPAGEEG